MCLLCHPSCQSGYHHPSCLMSRVEMMVIDIIVCYWLWFPILIRQSIPISAGIDCGSWRTRTEKERLCEDVRCLSWPLIYRRIPHAPAGIWTDKRELSSSETRVDKFLISRVLALGLSSSSSSTSHRSEIYSRWKRLPLLANGLRRDGRRITSDFWFTEYFYRFHMIYFTHPATSLSLLSFNPHGKSKTRLKNKQTLSHVRTGHCLSEHLIFPGFIDIHRRAARCSRFQTVSQVSFDLKKIWKAGTWLEMNSTGIGC